MAFVPWSPCTGCSCKNHHLPSYDYSPDRYILKNAGLTRLTRSNDPPLDAEVDSLQAMIASYEAELQSIQSEEAHLKAFILDMEHQVSAIQKTVDALPQERERISEAIQERKRWHHAILLVRAKRCSRPSDSTACPNDEYTHEHCHQN
ncbi:uncharacterized protein ARMOST_18608 [Armillaria ostoyae]|uniref:Uncharacterized protein n=1 Tax=Armillaria ostoyae TaxID=47428 RepID=A0A284S278_ARMOS|nr:uncharacterized protein ARMOST_18608 [Armillaria ostoyae]